MRSKATLDKSVEALAASLRILDEFEYKLVLGSGRLPEYGRLSLLFPLIGEIGDSVLSFIGFVLIGLCICDCVFRKVGEDVTAL